MVITNMTFATSGLQPTKRVQRHCADMSGSVWLETQDISFSCIQSTFVYYHANIALFSRPLSFILEC